MVAKNVIMPTRRGHFKQIDGVAMRSSKGLLLAEINVSKYDSELGSFNKNYFRYVDDAMRAKELGETCSLNFVNTMHENLKFTLEQPDNQGSLCFSARKSAHMMTNSYPHSGLRKILTLAICSIFKLRVPNSTRGH